MADVELSTLGSVIKTAYEAETNTNAYTDAEKTKLAGVEASADVTDTANVTAAGALMDSEVTNLAQVKAFNSADYATAAQGTTADAALPADGSGEMTGDLVFAEAADHSSTPGAGKGYVWVKNTAPSTLIFTDDTGADTTLGSGGGASQLSDLSDVNTSTATNRNVLVADGVDWESRALTEADISDLGSYLSNVSEDTTPQLGGALDVNGQKIVSTANGNIDIEPNGTGNVLLGNYTFDADQTVGVGQDNYVLTYDNASGLISLEAAAGGGGDLWSDAVDSDIVPTGADSTYDLGTTTDRFAQTYTDTIWITDGDITASVADGASAVAFDFNNTTTLSTSGAKLAAWSNNGTEKFSIDKDGQISVGAAGNDFYVKNSSLNLMTLLDGGGNSQIAIGASANISGSFSSAIAIGRASSSASSFGSIAIGNTASAASVNNAIAIGRNTIAGAGGSIAIGTDSASNNGSKADHVNGLAITGETFSAQGDNQFLLWQPANTTTNATPTTLYLDEDGASARMTVASGKLYAFEAHIVGVQSDGTDASYFVRRGIIANNAGTTALIGSVQTIGTDIESNASTDVAVTADDTNDALQINVTGIAAETWRWSANVFVKDITIGT